MAQMRSPTVLILIVLAIIPLGGGAGYYGGRYFNAGWGFGGSIVTIVVILLVCGLLGVI